MSKVCNYCNKNLLNYVACDNCHLAYFHGSCAKRVSSDGTVKCSACLKSVVMEESECEGTFTIQHVMLKLIQMETHKKK